MKTLLVVSSYHHHNTQKVARAMADVLGAEVVSPDAVKLDSLMEYDLVGFGSGIYDAMHHVKLLKLAESLPAVKGGKAFLFSTDGTPRLKIVSAGTYHKKMFTDHAALRERLEAKGYTIVGDFNCAGFNTNVFLKYFGGLNKGRPNADDLKQAAAFAKGLTSPVK
jgi:flavodoxin